jgi:hypothetical protein
VVFWGASSVIYSTRGPGSASISFMPTDLRQFAGGRYARPGCFGGRLPGVLLAMLLCGVTAARGQDQGPIAAPPKFEVNRIPSVPHPGPPPIPTEVIIQKFAANEDLARRAFESYNYTQTIRVEELSDPGGKLTVAGQIYTRTDGTRVWRAGQPVSDLKFNHYALEEVRVMIAVPPFSLTSDEIGNYSFLYAGQDKLDDLNTYVFQVKPKLLSRTKKFFEGAIWVDDHDFAVVKTYGKFVSDGPYGKAELPFSMYETYRENFQQKYWLPTYTNSDDYVDQPDGSQLHMRLVIRGTDFKQNTDSANSGATAPPTTTDLRQATSSAPAPAVPQ